jgi:hypothetical protein
MGMSLSPCRKVPELAAALAAAAADRRFGPSAGAAVKSITRWQGAGTPHCRTVHRNHPDVSAVCLGRPDLIFRSW